MGGKIWPPGDLHSHLTLSGAIQTDPAELLSDASANKFRLDYQYKVNTDIAKVLHDVLVSLATGVKTTPLG
jgi:hypothetical protein